MRYEIKGDNLPGLVCYLEPGEQMMCEGGSMSWMDDEIEMQTQGGGVGKMLGRLFSGEKMFRNIYIANRPGEIAFSSSFPGSIRAIEITPDKPVICQKSAFLAATDGVQLSVFFQNKALTGFFGGEGFIMQKLSGRGIAFIEIDGSAVEYRLEPGQRLIVDTGNVAMMDSTVSMDIQRVKGAKNMLFGGEGLFNTVVTGPGNVVLQTMPLSSFVNTIAAVLPNKN